MKSMLIPLFTVMFLFLACGNNGRQQFVAPKHWKTFKSTNTPLHFSIAFPENWSMTSGKLDGLLFNVMAPADSDLDKMNENINMTHLIGKQRFDDIEALTQFVKGKYFDNYAQFDLTKEETVSFHGMEARLLHYEMVYNELPIKTDQYAFMYNGDGYIWTYAAESARYQQYKPVADSIMASFTLLE